MHIAEPVPLSEVHAVLLVRVFLQAAFIEGYHVRPELVHVGGVGKVHHVGHVAAAGAHVYLQPHKIAHLA